MIKLEYDISNKIEFYKLWDYQITKKLIAQF